MTFIILLLSYVLGSIPNGLIFGKIIWNKDLRTVGSKNIGATNAWRTIGKPAGILIFALDFLKGALSVYLAQILIGTALAMTLAGIFAIVGHSFSCFLKFHGRRNLCTNFCIYHRLPKRIYNFRIVGGNFYNSSTQGKY